ncbi:MAG: hypothetical protein M0P13_08750 [Fibrobacteraceae bacterium]|nr:hypothetical protein [Fibrobacteraceae bacterium]
MIAKAFSTSDIQFGCIPPLGVTSVAKAEYSGKVRFGIAMVQQQKFSPLLQSQVLPGGNRILIIQQNRLSKFNLESSSLLTSVPKELADLFWILIQPEPFLHSDNGNL